MFPVKALGNKKSSYFLTNTVMKKQHLCSNHSSNFYNLVIYIFKIFPKIKPHNMLQDTLIIFFISI
jgi:hypothetical protein